MTLFDFRRRVATALLVGALPKPSTAPTAEVSTETREDDISPTPAKRRQQEVPPEVRYNGAEHIPDYAVTKLHCKIRKCAFKTFWYCTKCKVHLCLAKERNCFKSYHTHI